MISTHQLKMSECRTAYLLHELLHAADQHVGSLAVRLQLQDLLADGHSAQMAVLHQEQTELRRLQGLADVVATALGLEQTDGLVELDSQTAVAGRLPDVGQDVVEALP